MNGWTSIEQVGRMAAEVMFDEGKEESDVVVHLRRVARSSADGARWTATIGNYSSKAARTPEQATEEVAGMFRSALLCRIERAEKQIQKAREALPVDLLSDEDRRRMTEGSGLALGRAMAGVTVMTGVLGGSPDEKANGETKGTER